MVVDDYGMRSTLWLGFDEMTPGGVEGQSDGWGWSVRT